MSLALETAVKGLLQTSSLFVSLLAKEARLSKELNKAIVQRDKWRAERPTKHGKLKAKDKAIQDYEKDLAIVRGKMKSGIEAYKAFETAMADRVGEDEE